MAKKNKKYRPPEKETTIENFYDLKTKEMDELVAALRGEEDAPPESLPSMNIAEVTGEVTEDNKKGKKQFDPYKRDKFSAIPFWVKALFIKFWFFGAVCYFALMGLGTFFTADDGSYTWIQSIELYLLCGAIMGIFVDCFVNPIFRMMESDRKEYNYFMMFPFPFKQFWTFFCQHSLLSCGYICGGAYVRADIRPALRRRRAAAVRRVLPCGRHGVHRHKGSYSVFNKARRKKGQGKEGGRLRPARNGGVKPRCLRHMCGCFV